MEYIQNKGQVMIHIEGKSGAENLSPENYDITLMQTVLGFAITLLDLDKRKERPVTTYHIERGSVNNVFTTSKQKAVEFASVLALITNTGSIDQLDAKTAVAFEEIQRFAIQNNFKVNISSSESTEHVVHITPMTYFRRTDNLWADAEIYYYGTLVDAGGKKNSNIHLDTKDGLIRIEADKDLLTNIKGNPLYRKFGVHVLAKQNIISGEVDRSSLKLIDILEYEPKFDMTYLEKLIEASTPIWKGIDADEYLHAVREGSYVGQ